MELDIVALDLLPAAAEESQLQQCSGPTCGITCKGRTCSMTTT
ncbi:hypothetical protein ABT340_37410 [Streptosporangium sp. NPDC000239]